MTKPNTKDWPDLERTAKALDAFHGGQEARDKGLEAVKTDSQFREWEDQEKAAADVVRRAFLEDTADRNRWDAVKYLSIKDVGQFVAQWRRDTGVEAAPVKAAPVKAAAVEVAPEDDGGLRP